MLLRLRERQGAVPNDLATALEERGGGVNPAVGEGPDFGIRVWVQGVGLRVEGSGLRVKGLGFRVQVLGFRV